MFSFGLDTNLPVTDISFCRGPPNEESVLVQVSSGDLVLLSTKDGRAGFTAKNIIPTDSPEIDWKSLRCFTVVQTSSCERISVVAIAPAIVNGSCETLVELVIQLDGSNATVEVTNTTLLEDRVLRIVNWSDDEDGCLIELIDGSLLEYEFSGESSSVQPANIGQFLEPCPWMCAIKDPTPYAGYHHDAPSRMVFGLSAHSRLYYHDIMLTDSASSFYLSMHHEFLCYATNGSRCHTRFLPLKDISGFDPLMGMDQNHLLEGYEPRVVEGGAQIIAVLPAQPMAILQMPRGNLEGIYPRALVLRFVMLRIHHEQYGEAFAMMRRHKVDLNVLVDFDPWAFYETGIAALFHQVNDTDHLNLFLSGLQDFDITQSRFPVPSWLRRENKEAKDRSSFDFSTKVNQICRKARSTMLEMEQSGERPEAHFLLPVLSTFAKESPHKLDEALAMIKERAVQNYGPKSKKPPLFADTAQNAIRYLAFLAEYELLFETALGMYDFEIARAVARNSQMDPKVYLPLLKRFMSLPWNYAKYEVDIRLKRYEDALKNLFESNEAEETLEGFESQEKEDVPFGNTFDNCMVLIEKQKLHRLALHLYQADPAKTRVILISLGNSLMEDGKADSGLCAFLAAVPPALDEAKQAARAARDWRTFFTLLETGTTDPNDENAIEQRRQVARDIAREIVSKETEFSSASKKTLHLDAARTLLDYGDDLLGAIDILINAQCWDEAHRIASSRNRSDLIKKCTDGAIEYAHASMDTFVERIDNFESTAKRYSEILLLRKKNTTEEGLVAEEADETGSIFSAASNMSNMSLQSGASASSTGSATSSIISVKTASTFSMTNNDNVHRHRSKFNKGKTKKKKKQKTRRKPGSQEELNSLVFALKGCCPNEEFAGIVSETIRYLVRVQELTLAIELYKRYKIMRESIAKLQTERMETARVQKLEAEKRSRGMIEGGPDDAHVLLELPEEKEVDSLSCASLEPSLVEFFGYLSA
jgi:elongator complex protein 1